MKRKNEVLSKDTSARHIEKYVALSTVIPQCRSAGYNVVFFPAIPRTETLRGDEGRKNLPRLYHIF